MIAPTCSECNWFVASATDPETGEVHVLSDLPAGGWGGTPYNDGMHVTMDPLGNCQNLPAETAELLFPVRYHSYEMVTDSAGPGQHRGGCGVRLEVEFLGRGQIITMETSRTREGSPGRQRRRPLLAPAPAAPPPDGALETIGGLDDDGTWLPQMLGNVGFKPGESFVFESGGGGGWGDPSRARRRTPWPTTCATSSSRASRPRRPTASSSPTRSRSTPTRPPAGGNKEARSPCVAEVP